MRSTSPIMEEEQTREKQEIRKTENELQHF